MKRIFILFILFLAAITANAQTSKTNPRNEKKEPLSSQVKTLNQHIDDLIRDVDLLYSVYDGMEDKWFKDNKKKIEKIDGVKGQQKKQNDTINQVNDSINTIEKEMEWVNELRAYYENGTLDDLYKGDAMHPSANVTTLRLHMQLLGKNYPKKMNDLMLMAECANSLNVEYNAARNNEYRTQLGKMTECDTKWAIDGLLAVHGDIKNEIDKWDGHTLMDFMTFRKYLMNEYGVELDVDFPFLAEQARKKVELSKK